MAQWQVLTASSLEEGLALAGTAQPDALLLNEDILDPEWTTTLQLLQSTPATQPLPIVVMVGAVRPVDRQQFGAMGVAAVLPQWANPVILAAQIAAALGWSRPDPI